MEQESNKEWTINFLRSYLDSGNNPKTNQFINVLQMKLKLSYIKARDLLNELILEKFVVRKKGYLLKGDCYELY